MTAPRRKAAHELRSSRWFARDDLRSGLVALEGQDAFDGVQRFLGAVRTLAGERRLSRFMYLAAAGG